jgi:DNA-binding transcriptional regulator YhcF (GntR family)
MSFKYLEAAAIVRARIDDGTLRPGQPAPSGADLARDTGFSSLTCRKALRVLIGDGVLVPGPSRNARPRVASMPGQTGSGHDIAAAARTLSSALAGLRRAAGLRQAELAELVGFSVTTVGHAETGRVWQSRQFWESADEVLGASGNLLRSHDTYRAAVPPAPAARPSADPGRAAGLPPTPAAIHLVWTDGTVTAFSPSCLSPTSCACRVSQA